MTARSSRDGRAGRRRLTINDIARMTGLSKATVSRAMNNQSRVSAETRARVLAVLESQGYRPARAAKALTTGRSGLIALLIGENRNPNALAAVDGAVNAAEPAGYRVVVAPTADAGGHGQTFADLLGEALVDGALLLFPTAHDAELLQPYVSGGVPLVAIEPETPIAGITNIYADAEHDGWLATRHLLEQGHRRVGLLLDLPGWGEQDRMETGYRRALADQGVDADPRLVLALGWTHEAGRHAARSWLELQDERPTAAAFCCDTAALGALTVLRETGLSVPGDFALVGYDDSDVLAWTSPAITSPAARRHQLAKRGCEVLVAALASPPELGPETLRLRTTLTVRASTAGFNKH